MVALGAPQLGSGWFHVHIDFRPVAVLGAALRRPPGRNLARRPARARALGTVVGL